MPKIVGILLVLSSLGLLHAEAFARRTPNQLVEFMKKREQIRNGMLIYNYNFSQGKYSEGHHVTVRFFDVRRGPYNYLYSAVIAEDTFGNVLIYDLDSTYFFASHLKRKKVVSNKEFKHEEQYFYEPFGHYSISFYNLSNDTNLIIRDSLVNGSPFQIIESNRSLKHRYIFDSKASLPVYHGEFSQYAVKEYTLLDHKLNTYDSATFFRMLADSIKSLVAACPNPPVPGKRFYYMPPIQDTVAPDFTFASAAGDSIQLSKVMKENKIVLIDFWFKREVELNKQYQEAITEMKSLYKNYKGRGLEILSLNDLDKDRETVDSAITEFGLPYPVLLANGKTSFRTYRINGYPCVYILKAGRVEQVITYEEPNFAATLSVAVKKYFDE